MMNPLADIEWPLLRRPLIGFSLCLLLSGGLSAGSYTFKQIRQAHYSENNGLFLAISRRYLAVDQEQQLIDRYYAEFVRAHDHGLIGAEHRLNWMETLRLFDEKIKPPALSYAILAQREFSPEFPMDSGPYSVYASEMNLTLGLLHEGDLLKLLDYLDKYAEGIYSVSECQLQRLEQVIDMQSAPTRPNIAASCVLHWFTLDLADGSTLEWS